MKILIDARMYGLENAGIGRYLINLIEELAELKTNEDFCILLRRKHFYQLNLPKNWKKVLVDFGHYTFAEQLKLPSLINRENSDLVHFPHLNIPLFWKGKFVVTVHDLTMHRQGLDATTLPLSLYYIKRVPFLLIANKAVKESVKIITPSEIVKQELSEYYKIDSGKIDVIYEGYLTLSLKPQTEVSEDEILAKYNIKRPFFIYVGNVYPHKNLELVVNAIKILNEVHGNNISLIVGGSRDIFRQKLQEKVKIFGAEKYIKLIGYIPDEDLVRLYQSSIGFIYPSLVEGFGLQGLETMASGTILLASDIPVFKEIYGENAIYFDPKNVNSLVGTLMRSIKMPKKERLLRIEKARAFVKKYSWKKMAKETLKVYKESM